jgi:glucose-1-phosphate cytidylyltransferase
MKALILAGGKGTRMGSVTEELPKPMVRLKGKPILLRVMEHYARHEIKDFIILAGFKQEVIKEYFANFLVYNNDTVFDYGCRKVDLMGSRFKDWKVTVLDTGEDTLTGGRIVSAERYLADEEFFHITYGDGLSDVNLKRVEQALIRNNSHLTLTSVNPRAKFGEIVKRGEIVESFEEKPELTQGLINAGFMVATCQLFRYIKGDEMLEKEPMQRMIAEKRLSTFSHQGYWRCFDTKKDVLSYNVDEELSNGICVKNIF